MIAIFTLFVVFLSTIVLSYRNELFRLYMKQKIDALIGSLDHLLKDDRSSAGSKSSDSDDDDESIPIEATVLPSLTMKQDEVIQQLPQAIRQVILGPTEKEKQELLLRSTEPQDKKTTAPTKNQTTSSVSVGKNEQQQQQQQQQKTTVEDEDAREEQELLQELNPAVQIGLKSKGRSVRNLISQFEKISSIGQRGDGELAGDRKSAVKGGVPVMIGVGKQQQPSQQTSETTTGAGIDDEKQRLEAEQKLLDSLLPSKSLEKSIMDFIVDDEDYVIHLGRLIPEYYQKPVQQFRKQKLEEKEGKKKQKKSSSSDDTQGAESSVSRDEKRHSLLSDENQRNFELLEVLFDTLAKKMAADKSHLNLYNVKKLVKERTTGNNGSSGAMLHRDVRFLNALSEIVMQFVMESLSKQYIPYVRKYIAIRPKIQALLNDKHKTLQSFIRGQLDQAAENVQKMGKEFKRILSLEDMIAEPCKRLTIYLTTFRDEWYPYLKHAELSKQFAKTEEEQELIRQAAFRMENAFGKLEREMKDNYQALEKAFQMNKIYAIQKRLNMDTLSTETTDILATSTARKKQQQKLETTNNQTAADADNVMITDRMSAIPNFIYESADESEHIYRLKNTGEREDGCACEGYLFENMFILSWINRDRKRENMFHDLNGCSVESLGEKQFLLNILGEESLFECKTRRARQRWVSCLRSVLETGFFSTETARKLAEHIRQSSAQLDSAQDYYAVPLTELYDRPQQWSCFEDKDDSYNIVYEKSDTVNSSKRSVRAATLQKLVYLLTSPTLFDNSFLHSFMMTYQSFTTSEELIELLTHRYNMPPPRDVALDQKQFAKFKESTLFPIRIRVCQVIKHWIQHHSYIFRNDARARMKLSQFIEQHVAKTKLFTLSDELRDDLVKYTQRRDTFAEQQLRMLSQKVHDLQLTSSPASVTGLSPLKQRLASQTEPPKPILPRNSPIKNLTKSRSKSIMSSSIMDWSSVEIARQLTLIEFALFENIQVKECLNENWSKQDGDMAPNLNAIIQRSNLVVYFVAHEVLKLTSSASARAHAIQKWIKVARECRKINNFNACREIVGGLRTIPVSRLDQTWSKVDPKLKREFDELVELVSQKKNYKNMRAALSSCPPPCLPYVGTTLQDLTFINEGNKDLVPNTNAKPSTKDENPHAPYQPQLINFFKRQKIGVVIRALQQYQRTGYNFICVPELANRLQNMVVVSEQKLLELSLACEAENIQ